MKRRSFLSLIPAALAAAAAPRLLKAAPVQDIDIIVDMSPARWVSPDGINWIRPMYAFAVSKDGVRIMMKESERGFQVDFPERVEITHYDIAEINTGIHDPVIKKWHRVPLKAPIHAMPGDSLHLEAPFKKEESNGA